MYLHVRVEAILSNRKLHLLLKRHRMETKEAIKKDNEVLPEKSCKEVRAVMSTPST